MKTISKGQCMPGWLHCASGNDFTCVEDNGDQWKVVAVIFYILNLFSAESPVSQCPPLAMEAVLTGTS